MTSNGHLIFSLASFIFIKKLNLLKIINENNWLNIITGSIISCLLPDIDHPKSFLGRKLKWISLPIFKIFGHRGFTHSILSIIFLYKILISKLIINLFITTDISYIIILGYINHIIADFLTPLGVPLFWPCTWRFKIPILNNNKNPYWEKFFCMLLLITSIIFPLKIHFINFYLKNIWIKFF
ncbi:metal-dependent hydrolase [Sodalis-like secondary symbiont of Drepanosiphum platanoidis]|uniref:metal-dependent hydrolase n=1 Tax=Sodalis-like secondary symbiont of Drepanosiphum platanoidis TaxID=2994493 RepID=UPI0034645AEB